MTDFVDPDERLNVANMMIKYGGSFVKALGHALIQADRINTTKIKINFGEYWQQYKNMFEVEQVNKK